MGQIEGTRAGDLGELHRLLDEHTDKAAQMNDVYSNFMDFQNSN